MNKTSTTNLEEEEIMDALGKTVCVRNGIRSELSKAQSLLVCFGYI
jgi:hypothetical protein